MRTCKIYYVEPEDNDATFYFSRKSEAVAFYNKCCKRRLASPDTLVRPEIGFDYWPVTKTQIIKLLNM